MFNSPFPGRFAEVSAGRTRSCLKLELHAAILAGPDPPPDGGGVEGLVSHRIQQIQELVAGHVSPLTVEELDVVSSHHVADILPG